MSRRVVLGTYNDGITIGLRVSLTPWDALTDNSADAGKFSFDSEWTDIAQVHQVGLISRQLAISTPPFIGATIDGFKPTWSALGYKPFIETHLMDTSNNIYDDYANVGPIVGWHSGFRGYIADQDLNSAYLQGGTTGDKLLYIVYKIAIPVQ